MTNTTSSGYHILLHRECVWKNADVSEDDHRIRCIRLTTSAIKRTVMGGYRFREQSTNSIRRSFIVVAMTNEVPCSSGESLEQESRSVLKDEVLSGKSSKNNISIRTGEEFSMEFLQECRMGRQPYNGNGKVLSNGTMVSNGNHHGYEEVSVMLGLQRVDSVCSTDIVQNSFVKGSGPNVDMMELATLRGATANSDVPRSSAPSANDSVSSLAHQATGVSEVKVLSNGMMLSNGNHHMVREGVSDMLGLQRVDSVYSSNMVENVSVKGSGPNLVMMELATSRGAATNINVPRPSAPSTNDSVPSLVHRASGVSEVKVLSNGTLLSNGNHHKGYEGVSAMFGLQRVGPVCSSDMVENISVKGSGPNVGMKELPTSRGAATNLDVPRPSALSVNDSVPSLPHRVSGSGVSEVKVQRNGMMLSNGNHHVGCEGVSTMLGLQRVDSVSSSDMVESISVKGSGPNVGMKELPTSRGATTNLDVPRPNAPSSNGSLHSLADRDSGSGVSDDAQKEKIKFFCSTGGIILPRPGDGKLRYVGGVKHIVSIQRDITWEEFVKRTSKYCSQPHTIKYKLPGEDFDALISVSSNEDLQNMIEEYDGLGNVDIDQRPRIFLILLSESESMCNVEADAIHQPNPEYQYVAAINGVVDLNLTRNSDARRLTNEAGQSKSNMDQNSDFPQKQPPFFDHLEDNVGLINSNVTSQNFEPPSSTKSPDNFPLTSLDPVAQKGLMNGHAHMYNDPTCNVVEIPVLKGRAFHSETPIPQPADPMDIFLGSNTNGSHPAMPHAFSDPQLHEHGGSSCFGSPDGNIAPSTLGFAAPVMPLQLESVVLQEKSVEQYEHPVSYTRTDSLLGSFGSESLKRVNDGVTIIDEDLRKIAGVQDNLKENIPTFYQAEIVSTNISSATANGGMNKVLNVNHDQISVLHNLQVTDHVSPEITSTNLKSVSNTVTRQLSSNHVEKSVAEPALNSQRISESQQYAITGKENGEQGNNKPWAHNPESSLTGLLPGFSDTASQEPSVQLPSSRQMGMNDQMPMLIGSGECNPSVGSSYAALESPLCFGPLMQNPTTGAGHRREVSLMDEDFFNYTNREASNVGHEEYYNKMQKEIPSVNGKEDNQPELVDLLRDVSDAAICSDVLAAVNSEGHQSNATEAESTYSDSNVEDAGTDNESKDDTFSNALIAEMEADMYGLQIIKNVELEELKELGSGTYGTVYHGRWRGSDVAIKRIKKSCFAGRASEEERLTNDFWREARILSKLHHPNVVSFYGVVPDGAGGTLATVTEFMANGSLRNVLVKKDRLLDRRKKLMIAMDAAFGMEYLHSKNIVHFDLKCDNLLVNMRDSQRPVCKVGDFGLSRIKRNTLVTGGVKGTLPWMAPELLMGNTIRVSEKVDVFSFGITMWEILTGEEPYANMHCGAIIGGIVQNTLRPIIPEQCEPEWRKLMEQCWATDPASRPSFTEITDRLRTMYKTLQANGQKKGSRH
ncbi:Phox/Bem1p [Artemisia annua]|uniref:Phox/Bem1p n=1 Tax=Artemisia annua TaxID=35608 RepID=A0A2U1PBE9_ARTAN|nr:Phox/Bem1p [Artemisia annua]